MPDKAVSQEAVEKLLEFRRRITQGGEVGLIGEVLNIRVYGRVYRGHGRMLLYFTIQEAFPEYPKEARYQVQRKLPDISFEAMADYIEASSTADSRVLVLKDRFSLLHHRTRFLKGSTEHNTSTHPWKGQDA